MRLVCDCKRATWLPLAAPWAGTWWLIPEDWPQRCPRYSAKRGWSAPVLGLVAVALQSAAAQGCFGGCLRHERTAKGNERRANSLKIEHVRYGKRRGRDSNPRDASRRPTVFKTAAFVRSATPPGLARAKVSLSARPAGQCAGQSRPMDPRKFWHRHASRLVETECDATLCWI